MLSCIRVVLCRHTHPLSRHYAQVLAVCPLVTLLKSVELDILIVDKYDTFWLEIRIFYSKSNKNNES